MIIILRVFERLVDLVTVMALLFENTFFLALC